VATGVGDVGQPVSKVDTFGLAKVGAAVTRTAAGFTGAYTPRADVLAAPGALAGWSTGPALTGAAQAWGAFLAQLAAQVERTGADLTRSADEFRAADAAAGNRIAVAGHSPVAQ
jgi:hypothetical protein